MAHDRLEYIRSLPNKIRNKALKKLIAVENDSSAPTPNQDWIAFGSRALRELQFFWRRFTGRYVALFGITMLNEYSFYYDEVTGTFFFVGMYYDGTICEIEPIEKAPKCCLRHIIHNLDLNDVANRELSMKLQQDLKQKYGKEIRRLRSKKWLKSTTGA